MEESTKPRIRINAKQTSKGAWYFEATAETDSEVESSDLLLKAIELTEANFRKAGKELVGLEPDSNING